MRRILLIAGFNVGAALVLLILTEVAVRIWIPEITPVGTDGHLFADSVYGASMGLVPMAQGTSNGAAFTVNAERFWRYSGAAGDGTGAWLLIGDSVTMGIGVDPDDTFAGILAREQHTYEILNPSIVGYASEDYRRVVASSVDRHPAGRPARVTLFWCLNDVYYRAAVATARRNYADRMRQRALAAVRSHLHLYQWLKNLLFDRSRAHFEHDRSIYFERPEWLGRAIADISAIAAICAEADIPFDVVLLPYEYQFRSGDTTPQDLMKRHMSAIGVPVHDPLDFMRRLLDRKEGYLYGDGIHFSEAGHRVLADYLQQVVQ